ncbi:MAG: hypothetical protein AB7G48_17805 [Nitrospiraceae bacterium]
MSHESAHAVDWEHVRTRLVQAEPAVYELGPDGALALDLNAEGWMLELLPDGQLICQTGMDLDDLKSLLSEGTCEDLPTDELAKQAKTLMNRTVSKYRALLLQSGFAERTEINEHFVAVQFSRSVDFQKPEAVFDLLRWCRQQLRA